MHLMEKVSSALMLVLKEGQRGGGGGGVCVCVGTLDRVQTHKPLWPSVGV